MLTSASSMYKRVYCGLRTHFGFADAPHCFMHQSRVCLFDSFTHVNKIYVPCDCLCCCGRCTAVLKEDVRGCRFKDKLTESYPDPGPGEYEPQPASGRRAPKYTIRHKLAAELDPPPYPGPGNYDVESSTIGNWGAGMAAHIPESPDIFLNERIEIFRRQAAPSPEHEAFLEQNRKKLMEMRCSELAHGTPGAKVAMQPGSSKASGKGRRNTGGRSQTRLPGANAGKPMQAPGSGLLVEQHLYDVS